MYDDLGRLFILVLYALTLATVAVYGMHRYVLVYLYVRHKNDGHRPPRRFEEVALPRVTIQLPMFNEQAVAQRIIDVTCEVDWPRDRLQIQVLDDSTDESAEIARKTVDKWRERGMPIEYIHRTNREGYKAGALAEGMRSATGEFVAIFDADFLPPVDILRNVVDHFTDDKVGMVQVRWDHLNRDASLLTRGQAIFLDGHFVIEHTARNRSGRFMHFNGTAGVWRRTCIEQAGGWQHDTLTEDLDLSYRAQLRGWKFVYRPEFCAPAELPPEMVAFKQQAHRWTKGSMQTAIKLLPRILKSRRLPRHIKTEAFFHLTNTAVYPLMVLLTLIMYPAFIFAGGPLKHHPLASWFFGATLFILASCSAGTFFVYAQTLLFGRRQGWRCVLHMPYLMALGVGLSINNTKAVFEAFATRGGKRNNEFVRTPKYGVTGKNDAADLVQIDAIKRTVARPRFPVSKFLTSVVELAFGCYITTFIYIACVYDYAFFSVPFLVIFASGYFYVGISTIRTLWQMHADGVEAATSASAAAEVPGAA
jgi:cellulose synthase/poly-beta-1,6-N-acetylglucosamine synthase-like glycosyltransferase